MGKIAFFIFILDTLYSGGGVNRPFLWTFSRLIYHIYKFLHCFSFTIVHNFIHIEHQFKGGGAEKKVIGEHQECFPLKFT